jgi:polyisoprenoid-binding protein YceI
LLVVMVTPASAAPAEASRSGAVPYPTTAGQCVTYRLLPDSSSVVIQTGSSGLFGFLGHEHRLIVPHFSGEVTLDTTDLRQVALDIIVAADGLRLDDDADDADSRETIERTLRDDVLETRSFPEIVVQGGGFAADDPGEEMNASGVCTGRLEFELDLHGVRRTVTAPVTVAFQGDRLRARGRFSIRHSEYDLHRVKVAGVVNVAQEIDIDFDLIGVARAPTP